jgi:hypothetical protein
VAWKRVSEGIRARFAGPRRAPTLEEPLGTGTTLDDLIAPQIADDALAETIEEIAATADVREILEIGSSTGEGSTAAWVRGALRNPERPRLHCLEVSDKRFAALVERWRKYEFVHCHHLSSVPLERFPSPADVERFYREVPSRLQDSDLETVLGWLEQDVAYLREHDLSSAGIAEVKARHGIENFDAVLIDGSEFTGRAELDEVYGARFLLLDDTETFKNWDNARRLRADPDYRLVRADPETRYGFAVFERA